MDAVGLDSIMFFVRKLVFGHSRAFLITGMCQQGSNANLRPGTKPRVWRQVRRRELRAVDSTTLP
jgi:hypothetical protein